MLKYYLVEYYDGNIWLGTVVVGARDSDWALVYAANNYCNVFNEPPKESILIDTVDDLETETALEFDTYEEAVEYLAGGYGVDYDKN